MAKVTECEEKGIEKEPELVPLEESIRDLFSPAEEEKVDPQSSLQSSSELSSFQRRALFSGTKDTHKLIEGLIGKNINHSTNDESNSSSSSNSKRVFNEFQHFLLF